MEEAALLRTAHILLHFYQEVALALAEKHGIPYPTKLERVMVNRLETLSATRLVA